MGRIDPAAKTPARIRRNWGSTAKGGVASTLSTVQPVTVDGQGRLVVNVATNGGLDPAVGALKILLGANVGLSTSATGLTVVPDNLTLELSANALRLKSGLTLPPFKISEAANGLMGTIGLTAGTATVNNTRVTASTRIFLTQVTPGGTVGFWDTVTRTPGTSFTITSSNAADTSIVGYLLIEPA